MKPTVKIWQIAESSQNNDEMRIVSRCTTQAGRNRMLAIFRKQGRDVIPIDPCTWANGWGIINATPHTITVAKLIIASSYKNFMMVFPPSGAVAKIITQTKLKGAIDSKIPIIKKEFVACVGLPKKTPAVSIIVAPDVLEAMRNTRNDLIAPDYENAIRNEHGHIIGVPGFIC